MSKRAAKTFDHVRAAFETRAVLTASREELEELLAAIACETIADPPARARAREMSETIRQLLENRRVNDLRKPSRLAVVATLLATAALICCGAQAYHSWRGFTFGSNSTTAASEGTDQLPAGTQLDLRTNVTIAELAKRAPSLRTGTLQAWWAGEQARQVQRLEAQAKRQALAGDREGAARSASRADAIRSRIPALVDFEKPPVR